MARKYIVECDTCEKVIELEASKVPGDWIIIQTRRNDTKQGCVPVPCDMISTESTYVYACSKACHILALQALAATLILSASVETEGTVRRTILGD